MADYDAGSIKAQADVNIDPFLAGLNKAIAEGRKFAGMRFVATADFDVVNAKRQLAQLQILMRRISEEGVHPDVDVDTAEAEAKLAALRAEIEKTRLEEEKLGDTGHATAQKQESDFSLMRVAIEQLGPPLVPIGGAVIALGAELGNLGAAGLLAFKGISAEMKAGTPLGVQYGGMLGALKSNLADLEATSAKGVTPGLTAGFQKLTVLMPAVNQDMAQASATLGSIVDHLVGGLAGGFGNFAPLLQQAGSYVDHLAASFESWATGPGGASFAHTLATDLQHVIPFLSQIGQLAEHVVGALNGLGLGMLDNLTRLTSILNHMSPGEIQALATAYIAYRTAVAVTGPIQAAAAAWARLTGAEVAAGAAGAGAGGAGAAGGLLGAGLLGKIALPALATEAGLLGGGTIAAHLGSAQSTNPWSRAVGQVGLGMQDLGKFNIGGALSNWFGSASNKNNRAAQNTIDYQNAWKALSPSSSSYLGADYGHIYQNYTGGGSHLSEQVSQNGLGNTVQDNENAAYARYLATANAPTRANQSQLYKATDGSTDMAGVSQSYTQANTALQAAITTQQKWLNQGGKVIGTYSGMKIGANTYGAALAATNGDHAQARALVDAEVDSYQHNLVVLKTNAAQQALLNTEVSAASTKYGITTQQVTQYASILGITGRQLATGKVSANLFTLEIGQMNTMFKDSTGVLGSEIAALQAFSQAGDTVASRAALIGQTLVNSQGNNLSYANSMVAAATANQQMVTDLVNVKKGVIDLKTGTIDYHNAAAAPLLGDLSNMQQAAMGAAQATYELQYQTKGGAQAAQDAYHQYVSQTRGALIDEAEKAGDTADQAKRLADQYFGLGNAKDIKKQISLIGSDQMEGTLKNILKDLDRMSQGYTVRLDDSAILRANVAAANLQRNLNPSGGTKYSQTRAGGGWIYGHGTESSDSNPAMLSKGEFVVRASQAKKYPQLLSAINSGAAGYANGRNPYDGVNYGGTAGTGTGSSSQPTAKNLTSLLDTINRQLGLMGKLAHASASRIQTVEQNILTAAKTARQYGLIPSSLIKQFRADNKDLNDAITVRDRLQAKLTFDNQHLDAVRASMKQERTTVQSAVTGGFDIGTSGNGYAVGIKSSLDQQVKDAIKFEKNIALARKMGLDPRLIRQLEEEGPETAGANLQALIDGGKKYISEINQKENELAKIGRRLGQGAAQSKYGTEEAKWEERADHWRRLLHDEMKTVRGDVHTLRVDVHTLHDKLKTAQRKAGK